MQYNDNDKLLNTEGWSNQERMNGLSRARIINFVALIASSILAFAPWMFYSNLPSWLVTSIGVAGIMGLVTSSLIFYYFSRSTDESDESDEFSQRPSVRDTQPKQQQNLIAIIFTLSGVMMSIFFLAFLFLWVQKSLDQDYFMATNQTAQNYVTRFNVMFSIAMVCICLNILSFGFVCFALYIASVKQEDMRITIHTFNFLFLFSTFFAVISAKHSITYMQKLAIPELSDTKYIYWTIVMCLTCAIVSLGVYFINLKKIKVTYFLSGSFLLCVLLITAAFHFQIVRDTTKLRSHLIQDCGNQLRITSEQYLSKSCNCAKYIRNEDKSYSNQCNVNELGVQWEQDVGKPVNEQLNHQACLNMKCCGVLADSYSKWFFALSFFTAAILVYGFGLLASLFYLSQRPPFINYKLYASDFVFGAILAIIFISGISLYYSGQFAQLPPAKPQMEEISLSNQPSQEFITISSQQRPADFGDKCTLLVDYLGWNKMQCTDCKPDQIIRLSAHADNKASIKQSIEFGAFKNIHQLPSGVVSLGLFSDPNPDSTFSIQGVYSEISNIFKNYVYICPSGQTNIEMNFYQVHKSNKQTESLIDNDPHLSQQVFHQPSGQKHTEVETPATIKLVSLNQVEFSNVILQVYDAHDLHNLGNYQIKIKQSDQVYKDLDQGDSKMVILYNIQFGAYSVELIKSGYYSWIGSLTVQENIKPTYLNVWLTPRVKQVGQIAISLQWTDPNVQMALAATYTVSPTEECTAGLITGPCRKMRFEKTSTDKFQSQTIFINKLEPQSYLVYLQLFPNDAVLRDYQKLAQNGVKLNSTQISAFNDTSFFKSNLSLNVYTYEKSTPIIQIQAPVEKLISEINEPNLTWLALCIDGQIGIKSVTYSQDFWDYSKTPTFNQRKELDERALPTASLCDGFYGKH